MSLLWPIIRRCLASPTAELIVDDNGTYSRMKVLAGAFYMAEQITKTTSAKHVGVMLPTSGAFPVALLGCWIAGRVAVPLNYLLNRDELGFVIDDSDIDTIITAGRMLEFLGEDLIPPRIHLIKMDEVDFTGMPSLRWPPIYRRDDLAVLIYTSGTSGRPKGVMLSHGNLHANVRASVQHARITATNGFLGILPQFHSFGITVLTLIPLYVGAKVTYTARFLPKKIFQLIKRHQPDIFIGVPSMYGGLLSVKDATPEDVASLKLPVSGGEPLPDAVFEAFQERFNIKILEGYGLTETSPATHWSTAHANKRHSVGKALPGVRTFIMDESGNLLGPDQDGEVILAGPNVMLGYYKRPDLTQQVIFPVTPPGADRPVRAFRTGDIGRVDEDGFLYITGRKKEMLIIGGENVFPREIEEVLNRHPDVKASAVIGKSDGVRGEVPVAFVEIHEDHGFDEAAIRGFLREQIASFKVPREVRRVDELPRNPTGKILRRQLSVD